MTCVVAMVAIALCAAWTAIPYMQEDSADAESLSLSLQLATIPIAQSEASSVPSLAPLREELFAVVLWNPPPVPVVAPASQPEPPKPIKLQLVGIIHEGDGLRAAIYDAETDRLYIVAQGDQIQSRTITQVTQSLVKLTDGRREVSLRLQEQPS